MAMPQPANAGSLEDCFTNIVSLTELNGIKWRCYHLADNSMRNSTRIQNDPIMEAYGRCLKENILCTWRRKPLGLSTATLPLPSLIDDNGKELWVFWFNEKPDKLDYLLTNLTAETIGEEETTPPMSYDVRTLYFKALHVVIERTLLLLGWIRFGRWFTQPIRSLPRQSISKYPQYTIACNFQFFVYGEKIVCMTINAQRQPTLIRINKVHANCGHRVAVLLAPWSLRGTLLPLSEKENLRMSEEAEYKEWNKYVPLEVSQLEGNMQAEEDMPRMVAVEIDSIRMFYPSCLVCVTLDEDAQCHLPNNTDILPLLTPTELIVREAHPSIPIPTSHINPNQMIPPRIVVSKRNKLLTAGLRSLPHTNAALASTFLGIRSQYHTPPSASQFPMAPNDDELRWNFNFPRRSVEACLCRLCANMPIISGMGNATWSAKGLSETSRIAVNQQKSIQRPYHERTRKIKKTFTSQTDSFLGNEDDHEEATVDWANCETGDLQTGMYCSADEAVYHYDVNAQSTSLSDDETFVCSPFTPVRTISPCINCTWPAAPASQMPSNVFNDIFSENELTHDLPSTASLDRRASVSDYYYNPTLPSLWEPPRYASYHNRRWNEKRKSNYPPTIRLDEMSPDEPGSQETIPATTSPMPEEDARRVVVERESAVLMESMRKISVHTGRADNGMPRRKRRKLMRKRKPEDSVGWPTVDKIDMADSSADVDEDFLCKYESREDREELDEDEFSESDSPSVEEQTGVQGEEEIEEEGEEELSTSGGDTVMPMDVDEGPSSTQPTDSILSPPASNETPEQGNHWNRVGTPSVGDKNSAYTQSWQQPRIVQADAHSMNQIYPTPPSVQSDAQQFSPASVPPSQLAMAHIQVNSQLSQNENEEAMETNNAPDEEGEEETFSEEELPPLSDPTQLFLEKKELTIGSMLKKINKRPINGATGNLHLPTVSRFYSKCQQLKESLNLSCTPDYQKMASFTEKRNSSTGQLTGNQNFYDATAMIIFNGNVPHTSAQTQGNLRPPFVTQMSAVMAPPTPQAGVVQHPGLPPSNHPMSSQFMPSQIQMRVGAMGSSGPSMHTPPHPSYGPPSYMQQNQGMYGMQSAGQAASQIGPYGGIPQQAMNQQMQPPMMYPSMPMHPGTSYSQSGQMAPFARHPSMDMAGPSTSTGSFTSHMNPQHNVQFPMSSAQQSLAMIPSTSAIQQRKETAPEGSAIILALVLSDTILDLHFDTVFDACPICSCHTSIRARELGMYITPPEILRQPADQQMIGPWSGFSQQEAATPCTCGFSAVRHRYLSVCSGLFPEDAREATALDAAALSHVPAIQLENPALVPTGNTSWFDPENDIHLNIINMLRILSQTHSWGKAIQHLASLTEQMNKALKPQEALSSDTGGNAEYIVSQVDQMELLLLGNAAMELVTINMIGNRRSPNPSPDFLTYFHPWGLQIANEIREPSVSEWKFLLDNILNSVDKSMKSVRCAAGQDMGRIVEGPLTWRQFVMKNQKTTKDGTDEELFLQEPIPYIMASTEKDAIRIAPQAVQMWENLSLGPHDQPKDVLYVAVTVDCKEAADNTKSYLESISQLYERMRLGRHIACPTGEQRDGVLRTTLNPTKNKVTASPLTIDFRDMVKSVDNKSFMIKLKNFVQSMEESLVQSLTEDDRLFDRAYFRELLAIDWRAKRNANLTLATNAEKKYNERENQSKPDEAPVMQQPTPHFQNPQSNPGSQLTAAVAVETTTSCLQQLIEQPSTLVPPSGMTSSNGTTQMLPPQQPTRDDSNAATIEPEDIPVDDYPALPHVIVVYVVNPFTFSHEFRHPMLLRTSILAITRAFNAVCSRLPLSRRIQLQLEIVGMEQMGDLVRPFPDYVNDPKIPFDLYCRPFNNRQQVKGCDMSDSYRATCMSVYTQPRVLSPDAIRRVQSRCMTRFGPGSWMLDSLDSLMNMDKNILFKLSSNAICLAPGPALYQKDEDKVVQISQEEQILYVSYCLIGSDWLCATVTDGLGRLSDSCVINMKPKVEGRQYRNKTQILDAMGRLWTYILSVLSMETRNWRLVIGRLGRMGHGEFRAWTHLLNKASLRRYSARLKEICIACNQMPSSACTPAIVSACLVTTEAEPNLRIFHDLVEPEAAQEKAKLKKLSTPYDVSATHIMTYQVGVELILENTEPVGQQEEESWLDINLEDPDMDFIINDIGTSTGPQPSAGFRQGGPTSFFPEQSQDVTAENQPLASGYYISTAPSGDLPEWFWANCPSARRRTPVHLKASLHINVPEVQKGDDIGLTKEKGEAKDKGEMNNEKHPLDSAKTDEVLRHVLETYNALSWLNVNVSTGERVCCLPLHIQHLTRLYNTVSRLLL